MPAYVKMPKLSDTMSEGTLAKWLKKEGDEISADEDIAEVETDKATMSMQAFDEGILHKIYVKEGEVVPLGGVLALILEPGEEPPADADQAPASPSADTSEPESEAKEEPKDEPKAEPAKEAKPAPAPAAPAATASPAKGAAGRRIKASPLARKRASELGVDLGRLKGSGPGGRIVVADVENAPAAAAGGGGSLGLLPVAAASEDQVIALSGMRKVIAQRLLESKTTIPHFYLNIEIDAAPLMTLREQVNAASLAQGGPKYTVNDFIMRAAVLAAVEVPAVNASFQSDGIHQYGEVHLAVAVAVAEGLVTPVIRSSQSKSIKDLAAEIKDLATRARDKKLAPEEMQGGTLTLSNLGAYGIVNFDAIINPPQALILSVGAITKQPVVDKEDRIVVGQRLWIGASCDHRVVDGAVGAMYLSELKRLLESPVLLVS